MCFKYYTMSSITLILFSAFVINTGCTGSTETKQIETANLTSSTTTEAAPEFVTDHSAFDAQLKKYVTDKGVVNYSAWKKDEAALDKYLAELGKSAPATTSAKDEALAYWINAYNAFTIKLILKNYPVKSIQDINSGKPWDLKWIVLGGKTYTLNNIENDIIRPTFKDPRIHFALVCAAKSCPPLANAAFTAANLQSMLDARAKGFINSSSNEISKGKVTVSEIFDWYKSDFGNVIAFLNKYATTKIDADATIAYKDYDWSLNGK